MDRLYTPWRRDYVDSLAKPEGCVFCRIREEDDESAGILHRAPGWYVVLNKYPYTTGHMLVVLNRHAGGMGELSEEELGAYAGLLAKAEAVLRQVYQPQGLNVGLNLGRSGGAGVLGHLHWHILPRWQGDSNFVSVVGDTRVLPESLEESYQRLAPHFAQGGGR